MKIAFLFLVVFFHASLGYAAGSPFRACQGVLLLSEDEFTNISVTPEVVSCQAEQAVQILPEHGFFTALAKKLGAKSQSSAPQADFLKKVGERAAQHVARNNAITEVVIHCARNDTAWFALQKGKGEIYDQTYCPKLLDSMRRVVRELGPKARIARALMESEQSELAKLKQFAMSLTGLSLPGEKLELTESEKKEVAVQKEKTAEQARAAFLAFQKNVEDQFAEWQRNPVGPGPHPMMRKYAKSKAREEAESSKVHSARMVEFSRDYGAALQKAPVLAFLN